MNTMTNITYQKTAMTVTGYGALATLGMAAAQAGGQYVLQSAGQTRGYRKQRKLNEQGEEISKRLTDYNMGKQLEMWERTGPQGQMEQLKLAGLNPALIYGMGGAGGQTANIDTGSASGGSTPAEGRGAFDIASIAQLQLLQAQKENIEADTKNKEMDTTKKDQEQYGQGIENAFNMWLQSTDEQGNDTNTDIHLSIAGKQKIEELRKTAQEALNEEVKTRLNEKGIQLDEATINKMTADITQRAQELKLMERNTAVAELLAKFNTNWGNIIGKEALETLKGVIQLLPLGRIITGAKATPVQGFRRK